MKRLIFLSLVFIIMGGYKANAQWTKSLTRVNLLRTAAGYGTVKAVHAIRQYEPSRQYQYRAVANAAILQQQIVPKLDSISAIPRFRVEISDFLQKRQATQKSALTRRRNAGSKMPPTFSLKICIERKQL